MAYVARVLFFRSKCCKQSAGGIVASFSHLPILNFNSFKNSINKGNTIELIPKRFCTYNDYKYVAYTGVKLSPFERIYLPSTTNSSNVSEGHLLDTFCRITKVYVKYMKKNYFKKELKGFVQSRDFEIYCKLLEDKLPKMTPTSLLTVYEFINFPDLAPDQLINKICEQILNSINNFALFEKLCIYDKVLKNYATHEESNNIKKACEAYFEKYFETDILHQKFSKELLLLLNLNTVPKSMRQIVANKLLDDALRKACTQNDMVSLIEKFTFMHPDLRPKDDLKDLLHLCVQDFVSLPVLLKFSTCYKNLIQQDDFFYSKEILDLLFFKCLTKVHKVQHKIHILLNLCLMGYISEDMTDNVVKNFLYKTEYDLNATLLLAYVNIFVRSSFQDMQPESIVNSVRNKLESYKVKDKELSFTNLYTCYEGLTYLGCDTRHLCNIVFQTVTENFKETIFQKNALPLHHLAKVCLKSGYEVLSDEIVSRLLRAEIVNNGALPTENLNAYFGCEDYVLQNCVTSDQHCLHFAAIFGPDNKPIDLSEFKKQNSKDLKEYFYIDKIEKPPGSKVIAFQKFKDPQPIKFHTRPIMSGAAKLYLKSFENVDCGVVLLPGKFFDLIPKKKKEYLTEEIEQILNNPKIKAEEN